MLSFLQGKRTYLTGAAMIIHAGLAYYIGEMDAGVAINHALEGLGFIFVRSGINAGR